jgi:hypothetical protein
MDVAMVWYLAHPPIDNKPSRSITHIRDLRKNRAHKRPLGLGWDRTMHSKNRHWGVTGIAVQNGEGERLVKDAIPTRVMAQFAKLTLAGHLGGVPRRRDKQTANGYVARCAGERIARLGVLL